MRCPKCGAELPAESLYCEKCGEDIHIVPDYDPTAEDRARVDLAKIAEQIQSSKLEQRQEERERKVRTYQRRGLNLFVISLAAVLILLIGLTAVSIYRYNSPEQQMNRAEKYKSFGEYGKAAECYNRVMELSGEDVSLLENLADMYFLQNQTNDYEIMLKKIMDHPDADASQIQESCDKLISLLIKRGDFQGIYDFLMKRGDQELLLRYPQYLAEEPQLELPSGTYEQMQSLRILSEGKGTVYYTMDGTVPSEKSTPYTVPIVLDYGETTLKACFINEYGVKSPVAVAQYRVIRPPDRLR